VWAHKSTEKHVVSSQELVARDGPCDHITRTVHGLKIAIHDEILNRVLGGHVEDLESVHVSRLVHRK
jgi:hypothetical protein